MSKKMRTDKRAPVLIFQRILQVQRYIKSLHLESQWSDGLMIWVQLPPGGGGLLNQVGSTMGTSRHRKAIAYGARDGLFGKAEGRNMMLLLVVAAKRTRIAIGLILSVLGPAWG